MTGDWTSMEYMGCSNAASVEHATHFSEAEMFGALGAI